MAVVKFLDSSYIFLRWWLAPGLFLSSRLASIRWPSFGGSACVRTTDQSSARAQSTIVPGSGGGGEEGRARGAAPPARRGPQRLGGGHNSSCNLGTFEGGGEAGKLLFANFRNQRAQSLPCNFQTLNACSSVVNRNAFKLKKGAPGAGRAA